MEFTLSLLTCCLIPWHTGLFIRRTPIPLHTPYTLTFHFLIPGWLESDEDGVSLGYAVSDLLLQIKLHSNQL